MKTFVIYGQDEGRRLDRYLQRLLSGASSGFLYKMLRKKNITLNGHKATGRETLCAGDRICVYFSDETFGKFSQGADRREESVRENTDRKPESARRGGEQKTESTRRSADQKLESARRGGEQKTESARRSAGRPVRLDILYEDEDIILVNKPVGMMSQKAAPTDVSLCEHLAAYVEREGALRQEQGTVVTRPSVCNRLDRNTSGIVCCGRSYRGLRVLTELFRERQIHKTYLCIVYGHMQQARVLEGYLVKDRKENRVFVSQEQMPGGRPIITQVTPRMTGMAPGDMPVTLAEVSPVTGRSHQIRAHMAWDAHPLLGDSKYALSEQQAWCARTLHLRCQLLHCARMAFPDHADLPAALRNAEIEAPVPEGFAGVMDRIRWEAGGMR